MISAYLKDLITLNIATRDTWGTITSAALTIKGRFEFKTKLIRNIQGEQVVSSASVLLALTSITHDDKITYNGINYSIIAIEEMKDFSSKFLKIYLA